MRSLELWRKKQARIVLPGRESIYSKWRLGFVLKSNLLRQGQHHSDKVVEVWRFYLCVWLQGPARATGSGLSAVSLGGNPTPNLAVSTDTYFSFGKSVLLLLNTMTLLTKSKVSQTEGSNSGDFRPATLHTQKVICTSPLMLLQVSPT